MKKERHPMVLCESELKKKRTNNRNNGRNNSEMIKIN